MPTHFRLIVLTIAILMIVASTSLAVMAIVEDQSTKPYSEEQAIVYRPIVPELLLPQPARSYTDIFYCNTTDIRQSLDIATPSYEPHQLAPMVVYVHGGGWSSSSKHNGFIEYYRPALLEEGIAVVVINHRLAPEYIYPAQNQDVACALNYLSIYGAKYGLDSNKIGLFGESSGAQLITSVSLDPDNNQATWKKSIKAVVPFYGISDFDSLLRDNSYRGRARLYLGPDAASVAKQASAVHHPLDNPPDFYIYHGQKDGVIPYGQSTALHQYLQQYGGHSQLLIVKNGDHGFTMSARPTVQQIRQLVINNFVQSFDQPELPSL